MMISPPPYIPKTVGLSWGRRQASTSEFADRARSVGEWSGADFPFVSTYDCFRTNTQQDNGHQFQNTVLDPLVLISPVCGNDI